MQAKYFSFIATLILSILCANIYAQETSIIVRAKAKDGKFIGTSMGGIQILITDALSNQILAKGITTGSTGSTNRLMWEAYNRYDTLSTDGSAKFEANIQLSKPTLVTIEAKGPLGFRQAAITVSTQVWLIPGKDIKGDGIILEFPGFAVDVSSPAPHTYTSDKKIEITASIILMCGCGTSEGGLWDSSEYEITAHILKDGEFIQELPLAFTGTTNIYTTETELTEGIHEIAVTVYHEKTGNTGVDKTTVIIN